MSLSLEGVALASGGGDTAARTGHARLAGPGETDCPGRLSSIGGVARFYLSGRSRVHMQYPGRVHNFRLPFDLFRLRLPRLVSGEVPYQISVYSAHR